MDPTAACRSRVHNKSNGRIHKTVRLWQNNPLGGGDGVKEHPLAKESVLVWRIKSTVVSAAAFFICGGIAVFSITAALLFAFASLAGYLFTVLFYCPALYKKTRWKMDEQQFCKNSGVFFLRYCTLPVARIQYAEVVQSPAQRIFKVGTAVFHAAGARMTLNCLKLEQAQELVDAVNQKTGGVQEDG